LLKQLKLYYGQLQLQLLKRVYPFKKILYFGLAPGDDLLLTCLAENLFLQNIPFWLFTYHPVIFRKFENRKGIKIFNLKNKHLFFLFRACADNNIVCVPHYTERDWENDYDIIPSKHILEIMLDKAGIKDAQIKQPVFLIKQQEFESGSVPASKPVISLQATGASARFPMKNKEWGVERFQQVVDSLMDKVTFIQVGSINDPLLKNVTDKRGTSLLETAILIKKSSLFVGLVGMLMHLSKGINKKALIIFGGREHPWQSGYNDNINLYSQVACAPCWRWNTCDYDRVCMQNISPDLVIQNLKAELTLEC
jgi:ADP-heptose:LPS heptosyltransferase